MGQNQNGQYIDLIMVKNELDKLEEAIKKLTKQTNQILSPLPRPMPSLSNHMVDMDYLVPNFCTQTSIVKGDYTM